MNNSDEDKQHWVHLLVENGVPPVVAREAVKGRVNPHWGMRFGYAYIIAMIILMAAVVLPIALFAGRPCGGDFALNSGIALLLGIFTSIAAAGVVVGQAQEMVPLSIKKSAFVGAFANPRNLPYARSMATATSKRLAGPIDFQTYEAEFNRTIAPWFKWPTIVLGIATLMTFVFVPPVCV